MSEGPSDREDIGQESGESRPEPAAGAAPDSSSEARSMLETEDSPHEGEEGTDPLA